MAKNHTMLVDQKTYDAVANYLFKGTTTQVRKQLQELLFDEWVQHHQDIVQKASPPVLSTESDILEKIISIISEQKSILVKELLAEIKRTTTIKTLADLKKYLKLLSTTNTMTINIPKTVTGTSILKFIAKKPSQSLFIEQLKQEYAEIPTKMGDMVELPVLAKNLSGKTGLTEQQVYEEIYELYQTKIVDLQPGKSVNGNPLIAKDGAKFYWFQFR